MESRRGHENAEQFHAEIDCNLIPRRSQPKYAGFGFAGADQGGRSPQAWIRLVF